MITIAGASITTITRSALPTTRRRSERARTPSANTAAETAGLTMKKTPPSIQVM